LSGAAHAGVDYTWTLAGDENYFTLGAFGGLTQTFLSAPTGATATTTAPSAGAYLMYLLGNFTADLTNTTTVNRNRSNDVFATLTSGPVVVPFCPVGVAGPGQACKTSTTTVTATQASALATATAENLVEGNVFYKYPLMNEWYLEPTAGFAWNHLWQSMGFQDQNILKLQAGATIGTKYNWGTATVEQTLKALAYSDVVVTHLREPTTGLPVEDDQGQLWGKLISKWDFKWSEHYATSFAGAVYGTHGTEKTIGLSAEVELKYTW